MMYTYHARVFIAGGAIPVTVQARTTYEARQILEAQYGQGSVATTPVRG